MNDLLNKSGRIISGTGTPVRKVDIAIIKGKTDLSGFGTFLNQDVHVRRIAGQINR